MFSQVHHQPHQRSFDFARRTRPAELEAPRGGWMRREEAIMGTAVTVELWADDARAGSAACAAVIDEMHRIDRQMSPYKPGSELSRVNREAAHHAVPLSEELFGLVARALEFSLLTRGTFDISYAAVGRLYDYRQGLRPDDVELARARAAVGWHHLQLDARSHALRFGRPGMRIDLGGFAKGYAVDNAAAILRRRGIQHAIVSAGGDSRVIGDRRGRPWSVAIRDPRREGEVVAVLPLVDTSISTSGDYERCFDERGADGRVTRHHHIIDPSTGRSPEGVRSVTVLAGDGLVCEALSKTVFVLGAERGLGFVASLARSQAAAFGDVDVVVVDAAGRVHASSGLLDADTKERVPQRVPEREPERNPRRVAGRAPERATGRPLEPALAP